MLLGLEEFCSLADMVRFPHPHPPWSQAQPDFSPELGFPGEAILVVM